MAVQDYTALLQGYPGYQQQIAAINAAGGADQAATTALRQRLLAQFGEVPSYLQGNPDLNNALTRDLAAAATQGGVSTIAQLQRAMQVANNQGVASLAARGLARSGGVGQTLNQNLQGYQQQRYAADQQLQDQLAQAYQAYLGRNTDRQGQVYDATQQALQGIVGQINAGLIGGGGTATAPAASAATTQTAPRLASPSAGYRTVAVGSTRTFEPRPSAANFYQPAASPRPSIASPRPAYFGGHSTPRYG